MIEVQEGEASCCEFCGSLVIKKKNINGSRYSIPASNEYLFEILDKRDDIDLFIYDRLRRAEKIIQDQRKQLLEKK